MKQQGIFRIGFWALGIFTAASFAVLAFQQIISAYYQPVYIWITLAVAFTTGLFLFCHSWEKNLELLKAHKMVAAAIALVVFWFSYMSCNTKGAVCYQEIAPSLPVNLFRQRWYLFAAWSAFWFGLLLAQIVRELLRDLFEGIGAKERKTYAVVSLVLSLVVLAAYLSNAQWYQQYDKVYSIDSGWCYRNIFPNLNYYDIRHPIMGELAFPVWATVTGILRLVAPANQMEVLTAILMQWLNIQTLLLVGLMLHKLTGSRAVFWLYLCSFPTLLYALFFEKYQICTVLLVFYVYTVCRGKKYSSGAFILSVGTMPTNGFAALLELLAPRPWKDKLRRITVMIVGGFAALVCMGRGFLLNLPLAVEQLGSTHSYFGSGALGLRERLYSVINLFQSCFVALSSSAEGRYLWTSITTGVTWMGMLLLALMLLGAVVGWRDRFLQACILWSAFAFLLFVGLNWAPHETPLFSILFSWAVIPLAKRGIDWLIEHLHLPEKGTYAVILAAMLTVNLAQLADVNRFLATLG